MRLAVVDDDGTVIAAAVDGEAPPSPVEPSDPAAGPTPTRGRFKALLTPEGVWAGDGRQFAPDSLTWRDLPLPLMGLDVTSDAHAGAVLVGHLESITRDGSDLWGEGTWAASPEANRIRQAVRASDIRGVSVDVEPFEWELVVPPEMQGDEAPLPLFATDGETPPPEDTGPATDDEGNLIIPMPESKMRVTAGRIMGATVCPFPAFPEAYIEDLDPDVELVDSVTAAATPQHKTGMSDGAWDGAAQEAKLASPMPTATANAMYAWIDSGQVDNGEIVKAACKFPHHEVGDNGAPGVANLNACAAVVAALNGGRGGAAIPAGDVQGVYDHVAKHYADNDAEAPPLNAAVDNPVGTVDNSVTAAAAPLAPPVEWLARPSFTGYTPWTITDHGQVYGHLASWQDCHISFPDRCLPPPHSATGYAHFLHGELRCDDGTRVPVGQITMDTGHADHQLSAFDAISHYDHTGTVVADVTCGEDPYGIWIAGALRPSLDPEQVRASMAAGVSGDWRYVAGNLELVAVLNVNVPGFNGRSPRVNGLMAGGAVVSVSVPLHAPRAQPYGLDPATVGRLRALIASAVGRDPATRRAELRRLTHPEG